MTAFDGCLYFSSSGDSNRLLYVLKDGEMEQVTQLSQNVMAIGDGYVNYSDVNRNRTNHGIVNDREKQHPCFSKGAVVI